VVGNKKKTLRNFEKPSAALAASGKSTSIAGGGADPAKHV